MLVQKLLIPTCSIPTNIPTKDHSYRRRGTENSGERIARREATESRHGHSRIVVAIPRGGNLSMDENDQRAFMEFRDNLQRFRLAVLEALADIDVEVTTLREAIKEGNGITPKRLEQLHSAAFRLKSRFLSDHGERIGPL